MLKEEVVYCAVVVIMLFIMWVSAIVGWNRRKASESMLAINDHIACYKVSLSGLNEEKILDWYKYELLKIARWRGKKKALLYAIKIGYAEAKREEIRATETLKKKRLPLNAPTP